MNVHELEKIQRTKANTDIVAPSVSVCVCQCIGNEDDKNEHTNGNNSTSTTTSSRSNKKLGRSVFRRLLIKYTLNLETA